MVDQQYGYMGTNVFFVWGSTCAACIVFAYFLVPETKGLSLEQVDIMLLESTPRTSARWNPTATFANQPSNEDTEKMAKLAATKALRTEHVEQKEV